jgi:hypothetical protein
MFGWDFGISTMYQGIRVFYACRIVALKSYWYDLLSGDFYYICSFSVFQNEVVRTVALNTQLLFTEKHPACKIYNNTIFF